MNISLTKPLEKFIKEKVQSGFYHSASEVVRAGLRTLREKDIAVNEKIASSLKEFAEGNYKEIDDEFWQDLEKEIVSEIKKQQ